MSNTNKQKLDELLGIVSEMQKGDSNFNELINGITIDNAIPDDIPEQQEMQQQTLSADQASISSPQPPPAPQPVKQQTAVVSQPVQSSNLEVIDETATIETQKSLDEIDSLVAVAKNVITHVYNVVTSTDILDAATIAAAAKLIKETKELVQQHLEIQKDQRDFLNQIQMEEIRHQHQMQIMEKKFELEQKRMQAKNPPIANANVPTTQAPSGGISGLKSYSSADMMRMLNEEDGNG